MDFTLSLIVAVVLGYLLGSIPFGLLLTRAAGLGDVRTIGSGNIGATNVLRTGRRELAAATLVLDAAKGAAAVLIMRWLAPEPPLAYGLAGMAAFVGHVFPVWLGFRGGKGVATYIGVMLAMAWPVGLIFCAVWAFIAAVRRISSLSALTAAATAPIFAYVVSGPHLAFMAAMMTALLYWTHRANIRRLLDGTEPRIGGGASKES